MSSSFQGGEGNLNLDFRNNYPGFAPPAYNNSNFNLIDFNSLLNRHNSGSNVPQALICQGPNGLIILYPPIQNSTLYRQPPPPPRVGGPRGPVLNGSSPYGNVPHGYVPQGYIPPDLSRVNYRPEYPMQMNPPNQSFYNYPPPPPVKHSKKPPNFNHKHLKKNKPKEAERRNSTNDGSQDDEVIIVSLKIVWKVENILVRKIKIL